MHMYKKLSSPAATMAFNRVPPVLPLVATLEIRYDQIAPLQYHTHFKNNKSPLAQQLPWRCTHRQHNPY